MLSQLDILVKIIEMALEKAIAYEEENMILRGERWKTEVRHVMVVIAIQRADRSDPSIFLFSTSLLRYNILLAAKSVRTNNPYHVSSRCIISFFRGSILGMTKSLVAWTCTKMSRRLMSS